MILGRDPPTALQIGFLVLLAVSTAMVAWWIGDQARLAYRERDQLAALYRTDALVVNAILAGNPDARTIADLMPHLVIDTAAGTAAVRGNSLEALADEAGSRINRYIWEGGFFLLVLLGGMAMLTRAIRIDAKLRRRQQNFLASVSHEFKSPLASMRLSAETLALRATDPSSRRLGRRLVEDGDRLLRLVDNLLDTTQVEDGDFRVQREAVSLSAAAEAAVAEQRERAAALQVTLHDDVPTDTYVNADPVAVETVLRNLIDNALNACADAGANGHAVQIRASTDARSVTLSVADDGIGFPPGEAERIFGKFYRHAEETRHAAGTGLGLYVVRRLTALCEARAEARSSGVGTGAEFTVVWRKAAAP